MDETAKAEAEAEVVCGEKVCRARIAHSGATQLCYCRTETSGERLLERGDLAIVPTRHGTDVARVQGKVTNIAEYGGDEVVRPKRHATDKDFLRHEDDIAREQEAFEVCRAKIREHGLDMKLVSVQYLPEDPKILFLFSAEERVDFRELVRELVSVLRVRVELRQIGVRDEARIVGGMGGCSRPFCCSAVTDRLQPVSIKMAKEQNLTLNSMKISGPCGRLLCCLAYEYETYRDAKGRMPRAGAEVLEGDEPLRVEEVNVLTERLRLGSQSGRVLSVHVSQLEQSATTLKWRVKADALPAADRVEE